MQSRRRPPWSRTQQQERGRPAREVWLRVGLVAMTLAAMGLLVGCNSSRVSTIATELSGISANLDAYLADYQARYELRPRPPGDARAVAEAYMRRYQPGPLPRVFETTVIADREGRVLAQLVEEGYRTWVPLEQISPDLVRAIVATEDATFYTNPGYDARRVLGAMVQNADAGEVVSGASTITMQLARTLFFTSEERFEQSMERKAFETLLAQELTALLSKDEILEMYLNLVHFGRRVYGAEAAANLYFGKRAAELTLVEATLLAGIPNRPADLDPFTNLAAVQARQSVVLDLMVRHGVLGEAEAARVRAEAPAFNPDAGRPPTLAPHFVQYVSGELRRAYPELVIERAGLRVFTTLDLELQSLAQRVVAEQVAQLRPIYDLSNASLVALKPGTAEILVMVGSADFHNAAIAGQVNVSVRLRQPGSAIKPVLYALAFDDLVVSPATVIWDVEASYRLTEEDLYRPRNYDETFHGPVTVRSALANSYNIPAVKLLDAVGVARMLEGARAMGIASLDRAPAWYGLSLTLGGGDVTLLDLTSAFHTLANDGFYHPPQSVVALASASDVTTSALELALSRPVVSPAAAYLVTDILHDNAARTPAFGANSPLRLSRPAAVKTGTTTDYRDNWTVGYTRFLVTGVWAGNSDGRPMRRASGVTGAAPIWQAFMQAVLDDEPMLARLGMPIEAAAWEFVPPPGVTQLSLACPPGLACAEQEWFLDDWLERTRESGPLADSAMVETMNTVYVARNGMEVPLAACSAESGASRQLLRLPDGLGRTLPRLEATPESESGPPIPGQERSRRILEERRAALVWSAQASIPLYLGACDQVEALVRGLLEDETLAVRVGAFTEQVASLTGGAGSAFIPPPPPDAPPLSTAYELVIVTHDRGCGGNYVMGTVRNRNGQLVAGVRVLYRDDYGAVQEQATGAGAEGYGAFRFPVLAAGQPHNIAITLLNDGGGAMSLTATVPHFQGGPTDLGCHFVLWQGVD